MMKIPSILIVFLLALIALTSCGDDDDDIVRIEVRDMAEVAAENDADLKAYLQTHCYNYEEFQTQPEGFAIRFDTIAGANADKTPLIDQVTSRVINLDDDGTDVPHTIYFLVVREGEGDAPTRVDSTFVSYQGRLLNGTVFDNRQQPFWFDLIGNPFANIGGAIRGFGEAMATVRSSGAVIENPDGTVSYEGNGIGAAFMPSGLAYFATPPSGIPIYAPLVFTYDLLAINESDHDNDGVPNRLEDLNGDDDFFNDDTDDNGLPNYVDNDDDGDSLLTRDEIEINDDGSITFTDTDGDGTPDYLDADN